MTCKLRILIFIILLFSLCSCEFVTHIQAKINFQQGNYDNALYTWQKIVNKNPKNIEARFWIGKCYYHKGEWQKAFNVWQHIPDNNNFKFLFDKEKQKLQKSAKELDDLINLSNKKNDKNVYIDTYNKLIEFIDSNNDQFLLSRAHYILGMKQMEMGNTELAEMNFKKVIATNYAPLIQLIRTKKAKHDPIIYQNLIKDYPDSAFAKEWYIALIQDAIKKNDFVLINDLMNNIRNNLVKQELIFIVANAYKDTPQVALRYFKEYLKNYPAGKYINSVIAFCADNLNAFNNEERYLLGKLSHKHFMFMTSIKILRSVIGHKPETEYLSGDCYWNIGTTSTARLIFANIIKNYPDDIYSGKSILNFAIMARHADNYRQAIPYLETVIKKFPALSNIALWEIATDYRYLKNTAKETESYMKLYTLYPDYENVTSALWRHFWILYKAKQYDKAKVVADRFINNYKESDIYPQMLYWRVKIAEHDNNFDFANSNYIELTKGSLTDFYTYQAHKRLKETGQENNSALAESKEKLKMLKNIISLPAVVNQLNYYLKDNSNPIFYSLPAEIQELVYLRDYDKALELIDDYKGEANYDFLRACILLNQDKYHSTIKAAEKHENKIEFLPLIYPTGYEEYVKKECEQKNLEPALAMAVIWQESKYLPSAISYVGAIGLMQLMPGTAAGIAVKLGYKNFNSYQLYKPEVNIKFGTYYLNFTMKSFNQNLVPAIGSYNAGTGALKSWVQRFKGLDEDEFIESIPYLETRHYVKQVLTIYNIYSLLLS